MTVAVLAMVAAAVTVEAQRRRGMFGGLGRFGYAVQENPKYDGKFQFCRAMYSEAPDGDGGGWSVDYPRADLNLPFRLGQLTPVIPVSKDASGEPKHVLVNLTDDRLFQCPFVMMTEVGAADVSPEEAARLREYLLKGGFLWADDFWGEYAWRIWERTIRKVLPESEYPIVELDLSHPLFHNFYEINQKIQISNANFWMSTGTTSERVDSQVPHVRAIMNDRGYIMVLMTHNSDFGDAFEREGDSVDYFNHFAGPAYAFGVNAIMYALTH
jgi:hypothetical protein